MLTDFLKFRKSWVSSNESPLHAIVLFLECSWEPDRIIILMLTQRTHQSSGVSADEVLPICVYCISQAGFTELGAGIQDCFKLRSCMFRIILQCDKLLGWLRNVSQVIWRHPSERRGVFPALSAANHREHFYDFLLTGNVLVPVYREALSGRGSYRGTNSTLVNYCNPNISHQTLFGYVCTPTPARSVSFPFYFPQGKNASKLKGS